MKLLDPNTEGGGSAPVTEADYKISAPPVTEADQQAQMMQAFGSLQRTKFGNMLPLRPDAAAALPQVGKPDVFSAADIGGVHLNVIGTQPLQIPFTSYALQHQPSVNTRNMARLMQDLTKTPQGDPLVQRNIDNTVRTDIIPSVDEGYKMFGSKVADILQGNYQNEAQMKWAEGIHDKMMYVQNAATLTKFIAAERDKMQKAVETGNRPSPKYMEALANYYAAFNEPNMSIEDKIKAAEESGKQLKAFDGLDKIAEVYVPKDFMWGENTIVKKTVDEKGRDVPNAYSVFTVKNGQQIDQTGSFNTAVDNMMGYLESTGDNLGIKDDEKRKQYVADYMLSKSVRTETQTIHREAPTVIKIGDDTKGQTLPVAPSKVEFAEGAKSQDVQYATTIPPVNMPVGYTLDAISSVTGQSEKVDLGKDATTGKIVMLNVEALPEGKGVKMLGQHDVKEAKNSFQAPFVEVQRPMSEEEIKNAGGGEKKESQKDYRTYYIPLSEASGVMIGAADKTKDKNDIRSTADYYQGLADQLNDANATQEANQYYKSHYRFEMKQQKPLTKQAGFTY